ncbi:putative methyltransferase [Nymphaea thermarum]|nr:putative methyltransferase [Nymphaea thermarum]
MSGPVGQFEPARLRSSMQGFLDAFDPNLAATPEGIFTSKDEDIEFECVPTSLMDQVNDFLNVSTSFLLSCFRMFPVSSMNNSQDARGDLRMSMANDEMTLKNEDLAVQQSDQTLSTPGHPKDKTFNFQKKVTLEKVIGFPNSLADEYSLVYVEIEEEDHLYTMMLLGRNTDLLKDGRQELIVIASLLDRIPNLAGLARTCEVFKAAALAIADKSVMQDKQFQLISVTAEKWVPVLEVPICSIKPFLEKKKRDGFCLVGLEQTANSVPLDQYSFPRKTVLVLGREKEGIPVDIIHILDACVEIPQLGVVRSLNVHVSGAIAIWEYTRQQRSK